jgi:hypothetical protein|tara:strand:- start:442 stop:699 length:258 start_codon:yes stop_codon:yes gene_type:complete
MRKFTNIEAAAVSDLVDVTKQIQALERAVRAMKKSQAVSRENVKLVVDKHGEAHNVDNIVTISEEPKSGYVVQDRIVTKFNISER